MEGEKFTNTSMSIKALLGLIEANDIAIPEIQRPFVWKNAQVRDLMDSLYKGFPTGYIILWKNPNVKLKDGTISAGKKVVIDGHALGSHELSGWSIAARLTDGTDLTDRTEKTRKTFLCRQSWQLLLD